MYLSMFSLGSSVVGAMGRTLGCVLVCGMYGTLSGRALGVTLVNDLIFFPKPIVSDRCMAPLTLFLTLVIFLIFPRIIIMVATMVMKASEKKIMSNVTNK